MNIKIENNGPEIVATNYWDTEIGRNYYAVTANAGCLRVLVPKNKEHLIKDMVACEYAVVSTLASPSLGKLSLEILFEDQSDSPFSLQLTAGAVLGFFPKADPKPIERTLTLWVSGLRKVATIRAFTRTAPRIPYLKPMAAVR